MGCLNITMTILSFRCWSGRPARERPCFPEWQHVLEGWYEEDRNVKGTVFINTKPQDPTEKATFS